MRDDVFWWRPSKCLSFVHNTARVELKLKGAEVSIHLENRIDAGVWEFDSVVLVASHDIAFAVIKLIGFVCVSRQAGRAYV